MPYSGIWRHEKKQDKSISPLPRGEAPSSGAFVERLRVTLRAFRHRNYRLYFAGQAVSLTGAWMQQIAMSWLVYRLTGSALLLGVVSFSGQIAHLLVTPFAGVLADRFSRHRILVIMQTLAMIQAAALAFITLSGLVAVWHLVVLSLMLGIVNATEMPVRQSSSSSLWMTGRDSPTRSRLTPPSSTERA